MARASFLVCLLAAACVASPARTEVPAASPASPASSAAPTASAGEPQRLPDACQGPGHALGPEERTRLATLEAQMVEAFFDDTGSRWGALKLGALGAMARKYPAYETVLSLPLATPLPASSKLRVRAAVAPFDAAKTKTSVFLLEVRDVEATAGGALRFMFAAVPAGPHPPGVLWMWGDEGVMCATEAAGRYEIRPAGASTAAPE